MQAKLVLYGTVLALTAIRAAQAQSTVPVTVDNFIRAESDMYAANLTKEGGLGKLNHRREPSAIDKQSVIRTNRDTLYTSAVFDLDAAPVTITLPDAGKRFMSLQAISEDHYTRTFYGTEPRTFTAENVGTRYLVVGIRTLVDPVRHLIGSASAWGGNPDKDATYLNVTPERNDGSTVYKLNVRDVPVDAFWSVSVYNAEGYFEKNPENAYSINNLTAKKKSDGSIAIQFGGCDDKTSNCLPIVKGWNYTVRLYRPRAEILNGKWKFPEPQPVS